MKILHINTYNHFGGAAIACNRISDSINWINSGSSSVFNKDSVENNFLFFREEPFPQKLTQILFAFDILYGICLGVSKEHRFSFSVSKFGRNFEKWESIQKADILHLHWFNQGLLSLKGLDILFKLRKPIVWTLHDMYSFTGGCHYAGNCTHFQNGCGNCFMLDKPQKYDFSYHQLMDKKRIYAQNTPYIICPSHWMGEQAKASYLLGNSNIKIIPNPINLDQFKPGLKSELRKKRGWDINEQFILLSAFKINNTRKGFKVLWDSLKILKLHPFSKDLHIRLILLGEITQKEIAELPFPSHCLGYVKNIEEIIELNQLSDVYATASQEDNLPNTIMEALSCGLPTVAYRIGGIPDLVEHKKTGYLALPGSIQDYAMGIIWCLENMGQSSHLTEACRLKATHSFGLEKIGLEYWEVYKELLSKNSLY